MSSSLRRLAAAGCIFALMAVAFSPFLWRHSVYKSVRRLIEQGDEGAAIREVDRLSRNRLFKPDWTPRAAMPSWRWVYAFEIRVFGCPSCRGGWQTLLQRAAQRGQPRLVAALIKSGAAVDFYGDRGCQALVSAVGGAGDTNVIATLLAHGADVNARNAHSSVLHIAAGFSRKPEVLEFLLDAGGDPNLTDSRGWTPLDWASVWNTNMRQVLLAHGGILGTNRRVALPTMSLQRR